MENGHFTQQEIFSQPEAWNTALKVLDGYRQSVLDLASHHHFDHIIFTGCGSTYFLALAAAALTQQMTGLLSRAFPASELWLYPRSSFVDRKSLLVAVSRSGETTETLQACQAFLSNKRGELLTLSCYDQMPLAKMGTVNIVLPSGQEQSVAQTRAFSTLYLATVAFASLWAGRMDLYKALDRLPEAGRHILDQAVHLAVEIGADISIDRFYWLGSGPRYGLAAELSLKMKEMSLSHSEPFHFLEFRHGPKSMVTPSSLVIGLQSSINQQHESAVLADVKTLGGSVVEIAETGASFQFNSGLDEAIRNVLYLPVGQMIAYQRSISKGLDPDLPNNLDTVVKLSGGAENQINEIASSSSG
jgi:glucosamine--fructose-6-phosphate aminotransferase (isomerizing)